MDRRRIASLLSVAGLLLLLAGLGVLVWAWLSDLSAEERRLVVVVAVVSAAIGFLLEGFSRVCVALHELEQRLARLERDREK